MNDHFYLLSTGSKKAAFGPLPSPFPFPFPLINKSHGVFCVPLSYPSLDPFPTLQPFKPCTASGTDGNGTRCRDVVFVIVVAFVNCGEVQMQRLNENECTFDAKLRLMEMQTARTALVGHLKVAAKLRHGYQYNV